MEDSLLSPEPKVNSDFYKKLQQQIVQKENIIKLLQLKVKNLEEERDSLPVGAAAAEADPQAARRLEALEKRVKALEKSEQTLQEENDTLARRSAKDEETINDLEARLALAADELAKRDEAIERLQASGAAPSGDDRRMLTQLEAKLARKDEELTRLKAELSEPARPGSAREVEELRREVTQLRADKGHLEQVIGQLKERTAADGLLDDQLAKKEEDLRASESERARLLAEAEKLEKKLEEARSALENASPTGSFQLVQAIITLFQRLQDLRDKTGPHREYTAIENSLREISGLIGLERIKSVGRTVDPELHQVSEVVYSTEHPHNTIIRETAQGYACRSAVVKLAEVIVSRNPYWCKRCEKVAAEGSRYCNICGEKVMGRESPDIKVLDPQLTIRSFLDLANAREENGELDEADKTYHRVLELDPRSAGALWGMVRVREATGRYREAMEVLERLASTASVTDDLERVRGRLKTKMEIVERLQVLF